MQPVFRGTQASNPYADPRKPHFGWCAFLGPDAVMNLGHGVCGGLALRVGTL